MQQTVYDFYFVMAAFAAMTWWGVHAKRPILKGDRSNFGVLSIARSARISPIALERAGDHVGARWPDVERSRHEQKLFAGELFRLSPELIGPAQDRHVERVLEVRETNDSVRAVRRAHAVWDVVAVEAENAFAPAGEVPAGLRAHGADSGDDDVECLHRICNAT